MRHALPSARPALRSGSASLLGEGVGRGPIPDSIRLPILRLRAQSGRYGHLEHSACQKGRASDTMRRRTKHHVLAGRCGGTVYAAVSKTAALHGLVGSNPTTGTNSTFLFCL